MDRITGIARTSLWLYVSYGLLIRKQKSVKNVPQVCHFQLKGHIQSYGHGRLVVDGRTTAYYVDSEPT